MRAVELANNGRHQEASALFQQAGNQYRNPTEKKVLWDAAQRSRYIHNSD
jgi:hypothetical protein